MPHMPSFGAWIVCLLPVSVIVAVVFLVKALTGKPREQFGPGQYIVRGVHRQTGADCTQVIDADSPANAHVKAELQGIVVTSVVKNTP